MEKQRNPSEVIEDFVDLIKESEEKFSAAKKECERLDSLERHAYWSHKFEFAKDKSERNRLATAFQKERKQRREYKDVCDLYKAINNFSSSDNNKPALKRLRGMLNLQKSEEKYLESDREYYAGGEMDADS